MALQSKSYRIRVMRNPGVALSIAQRSTPVAESVPNTQPNPRRNSKFIYGNELRVPFGAHPSDR